MTDSKKFWEELNSSDDKAWETVTYEEDYSRCYIREDWVKEVLTALEEKDKEIARWEGENKKLMEANGIRVGELKIKNDVIESLRAENDHREKMWEGRNNTLETRNYELMKEYETLRASNLDLSAFKNAAEQKEQIIGVLEKEIEALRAELEREKRICNIAYESSHKLRARVKELEDDQFEGENG